MSIRLGKKRGPGCECTTRYTCRACCDNAPPYFYTHDSGLVEIVIPVREPKRDEPKREEPL